MPSGHYDLFMAYYGLKDDMDKEQRKKLNKSNKSKGRNSGGF